MKHHNSKDHVEKNTLINLFKKGAYKLNPDNPVSAAGNRKVVNEPLKIVDNIEFRSV